MRPVVAWIAPRLGRAVLGLAVTVLLLGIALAALAVHVAGWPYRRAYGPSRQRAFLQAGLAAATSLAALAALLRARSPERGGAPASTIGSSSPPS